MTVVDPTPSLVATALQALEMFLRDREPEWSRKVQRCAELVRAGNPQGLSQFLALHGGMGSLNDLVFDPLNGNVNDHEDPQTATSAFHELDEHAYELTEAAARQAGASNR